MRRAFNTTVILALVAVTPLLSACGDVTSDSSNYSVNGKTAHEYYGQFIYREETDGLARYRYLNAGPQKLGLAPTGEDLFYEVSIFLLQQTNAQGQAVAVIEYRESTPRGWRGQRLRRETTWSVNETHLEVKGYGRGNGVVFNDEDAVIFTFSNDLLSPLLQGKAAILTYVHSSRGLGSE